MLPVSLVNTVFIGILILLILIIVDCVYNIIQQLKLYKTYTRHKPQIFCIPFHQLVNYPLYEVVLEQHLASIAILHVETCGKQLDGNSNIVLSERKCEHSTEKLRSLICITHLWTLMKSIFCCCRGKSKYSKTWKEEVRGVPFLPLDKPDANQKGAVKTTGVPSIIPQNSSLDVASNTQYQNLHSHGTSHLADVCDQTELRKAYNACFRCNQDRTEKGQSCTIESTSEAGLPVLGLYLGEELVQSDRRYIAMKFRKQKVEVVPQSVWPCTTGDPITSDAVSKSVGNPSFSIQEAKEFTENIQDSSFREADECVSNKVFLETHARLGPDGILSLKSKSLSTQESPMQDQDTVQSLWREIIHREASQIRSELSWEKDPYDNVLRVVYYLSTITRISRPLLESTGSRIVREWLLQLQHIRPCYNTLFITTGVHAGMLRGIGSGPDFKNTPFNQQSFSLSQLPDDAGGTSERDCTIQRAHGDGTHPSFSDIPSTEKDSGPAKLLTGETLLPETQSSDKRGLRSEFSHKAAVENDKQDKGLETDSVRSASRPKGNSACSQPGRNCSNTYNSDSLKRYTAGILNVNQQNHTHNLTTINDIKRNISWKCSLKPGNDAYLSCVDSPKNQNLQCMMIRCLPSEAQDAAMLPKAQDQRISYIIGADHGSLLQTITTDATRTFAHGFTNFVCFYTPDVEKETIHQHKAKSGCQRNRSLDSKSQVGPSANGTVPESLARRAHSEYPEQKVKFVHPSLTNSSSLTPSDVDDFTINSKDQTGFVPNTNQKSEHDAIKGSSHALSNGDGDFNRWGAGGKSWNLESRLKFSEKPFNRREGTHIKGFQERKNACCDPYTPVSVSVSGQSYLIRLGPSSSKKKFHQNPLSCHVVCPFREVVERHWLEEAESTAMKHTAEHLHTTEKFSVKKLSGGRRLYSFLLGGKQGLDTTKETCGPIERVIPTSLVESTYVELGPNDVEVSELALNALRSQLYSHLSYSSGPCGSSSGFFSAASFSNLDEESTDLPSVLVSRKRTRGRVNKDARYVQHGNKWVRVTPKGYVMQDVRFTNRGPNNCSLYTLNNRAVSRRHRIQHMERSHNLKIEKETPLKACRKAKTKEDMPVSMAILLFVPSPRTSLKPQATFSEHNISTKNRGAPTISESNDETSKAPLLERSEDTYETRVFLNYTQREVVEDTEDRSTPYAKVEPSSLREHFDSDTIVAPVYTAEASKLTDVHTRPLDITAITVETPCSLKKRSNIKDGSEIDEYSARDTAAPTAPIAPLCALEEESVQQQCEIVVLLYGATTSTVLKALFESEQSALCNTEIMNEKAGTSQSACENISEREKNMEDSSRSYLSAPSRNIDMSRRDSSPHGRRIGNDNMNTSFAFSLPNCSFTETFVNDTGLISERVHTSLHSSSIHSEKKIGHHHDCRLMDNDAPYEGSFSHKGSITSSFQPSPTLHITHIPQLPCPQLQQAAVVGVCSHGMGAATSHGDPCSDLHSNAPSHIHDDMLHNSRKAHEETDDETLALGNATDNTTFPLSQRKRTRSLSPERVSPAEPGVYLVNHLKEDGLENFASGDQEGLYDLANDILAPVCDPVNFPQGLHLPVKLLYIRIGNYLYNVVEVVDQTFTQYRERRVFKTTEAQKPDKKREEGSECPPSFESLMTDPTESIIDRMKNVYKKLMCNLQQTHTNKIQSQTSRRKRPFAMNVASRDSVFSISPTTSAMPDMECQRVRMCWQCLSTEAKVIFLPCGHFGACERCSDAMVECFVCRTRILSMITLAD